MSCIDLMHLSLSNGGTMNLKIVLSVELERILFEYEP